MPNKATIMKELKRRVINTNEPIDERVYDQARLTVRPLREQVRDGTMMWAGRINKTLGTNLMSVEIGLENLGVCRTNQCRSYGTLANDDEVCHRCQCHGKDLHTLVRLTYTKCPAGLWNNKERNDARQSN